MVDRYTKAVLTVIAICLVILIARDVPLIKSALAQANMYEGAMPVVVRGFDQCRECSWDYLLVKEIDREPPPRRR